MRRASPAWRHCVNARWPARPFDYDTPVAGLRALDRNRFEVRLDAPAPRFVHLFADASLCGAVAREVVEAAGDRINEQPVGIGPFRLAEWRRGSRIVRERNARYRDNRNHETR
jgi:ABC-type oligopeptide transport system substrate-binding subunit